MSDELGAAATLAEPRVVESDLSKRIEQTVQREASDRVKCVRVFDDCYRCNWWSQPSGDVAASRAALWSVVATERVRKSRFLKATLVGGELIIKELHL